MYKKIDILVVSHPKIRLRHISLPCLKKNIIFVLRNI